MAVKNSRKFTDWLDSHLAGASPGARLPVDRALARTWGLSSRTVADILRAYAAQKRLVRLQGTGTFVPPGPLPASDSGETASTAVHSAAQHLAESLRRSFSIGTMQYGEALPSVKYLSRRFSVSPRTVSSAYAHLARQGLVSKTGKTWWFGEFGGILHPAGRKDVYFILPSPSHLDDVYKGGFYATAYSKMENVLTSSGFLLRTIYMDDLKSLVQQWISTRAYPYGLVFYRTGRSAAVEEAVPLLEKLLARAGKGRIPVIFDWDDRHWPQIPRQAHIFNRGSLATSTARTLAVHLATHSRRRIVCFVDYRYWYDNPIWNFRFIDCFRIRAEARNLDDRFSFALYLVGKRSIGRESLIRRIHTVDAHLRAGKYGPVGWDTLEPEIHHTASLADTLANLPRPCALVFQTDELAAQALGWANATGRKVPQDLSLISLDNDPRFAHLGISRCLPEWEALGYVLAHCVIGDFKPQKTSHGFLRLPARVYSRLTS